MRKLLFILFSLFLLFSIKGVAQDFVYTPINPAFGGNPYNYGWLHSSAQAQDITKDKTQEDTDPYGRYRSNPVDDFAESLNRQILSQLSRQIVSRQFGEDALAEGSYLLGDYQIDISNTDGGLTISIVDIITGTSTYVSVPYF